MEKNDEKKKDVLNYLAILIMINVFQAVMLVAILAKV